MKRFVGLLILCLLLAGCAVPSQTETVPTHETEQTQATEPAGTYAPGSAVEEQTGGAVRVYPMELQTCYAIAPMGGELLVFSQEGENTAIMKLSGENLYVAATAQVEEVLHPSDASLGITEKGLSYYDSSAREMVFLDTNLKEVLRFAVPESMVGPPVLSANRQTMYYCTDSAVYALDLENQISRLLKEISYPEQTLSGLLLEDSILRLNLWDQESEPRELYISTENGETLSESGYIPTLFTQGQVYYTNFWEGSMNISLFGQPGTEQTQLWPKNLDSDCWFIPQEHAAVTGAVTDSGSAELDYYDLTTGHRVSSLELENFWLWDAVDAPEEGQVYLLGQNEDTGAFAILRWDAPDLPAEDDRVYTGVRYTVDVPDETGLVQCREYADSISLRFGVEIRIAHEAVEDQPWDYTMEIEYQVPVIQAGLEELERLLERYPEGFLKTAAEGSDKGALTICLVRSLNGSPESGSLESAEGIQFWVEENPYIALALGQATEQTFYHEIFHVIDTRVLSTTNIYYEWGNLNPEGFEYDYDYVANQDRVGDEYLAEGEQWFIDTYSMSFPKEDRARIMEYAMTDGCETYFQSDAMQAKLLRICRGIRKAFGLTDSPEEFPWEQYLEKPLAVTG